MGTSPWRRGGSPAPRRAPAGLLCGLLLLSAAGCGAPPAAPPSAASAPGTLPPAAATHDMSSHAGMNHATTSYAFGEPGQAADSTRVVDIAAGDNLQFDPAAFDVQAGETVTLRVTNRGAMAHDFTLGDAATQSAHATEMAGMAGTMSGDEPNGFVIEPGQSKDLVWHFTMPGEVTYACHTPGHIAAGMLGSVTVRP